MTVKIYGWQLANLLPVVNRKFLRDFIYSAYKRSSSEILTTIPDWILEKILIDAVVISSCHEYIVDDVVENFTKVCRRWSNIISTDAFRRGLKERLHHDCNETISTTTLKRLNLYKLDVNSIQNASINQSINEERHVDVLFVSQPQELYIYGRNEVTMTLCANCLNRSNQACKFHRYRLNDFVWIK